MRFIYLALAAAVCCNGAWIIGEGNELLGVVHLCFGFQLIVLSRMAAIAGMVRDVRKRIGFIDWDDGKATKEELRQFIENEPTPGPRSRRPRR